MAFKQIEAKEGDRWDNIAQREYGDVSRMNDIRSANPTLPTYHHIPGGTLILIPIIEDNNIPADGSQLPPWKQ